MRRRHSIRRKRPTFEGVFRVGAHVNEKRRIQVDAPFRSNGGPSASGGEAVAEGLLEQLVHLLRGGRRRRGLGELELPGITESGSASAQLTVIMTGDPITIRVNLNHSR